MAIGDFHLHSTASDGVQTPTWVMEHAHAAGVRLLSLTDHDTTAGLEEAHAAVLRLGQMRLIPGIELGTDFERYDVHLLAYGFDPGSERLQSFLAWQRRERVGRVEKIVDILRREGATIDVARVFAIAGEASVGRPHVARALVERGHVRTVQEAFDRWLANGGVADVPRAKLAPKDAIDLVHDEGGVVFAAHPFFLGETYVAVLESLAREGIDGIETYYKHYDGEGVGKLAAMAAKLGLARSGGSDYHGLGNPDDRPIGAIPFADYDVERFVAFIDAHCSTPEI